MNRITDFFICRRDCEICYGEGYVCEDHPKRVWGGGWNCCGAPGMPCPNAIDPEVLRESPP